MAGIYILKQKHSYFAENRLVAFKIFIEIVGLRVGIGESNLSGKINYYPDDKLPTYD
ncbi:MAG: hypothetical protein IPO78_16320 [Saprospiraceae bacterium]|nr:hypothetical protein [Saprospiraceae bacterium]